MKWVFLAGAIALEVTGSLSLKAAVDAPGFFALVAVGYIGAFTLLAGALKGTMSKAAYLFNALPTKAVRTIDALREKQEKAA